MGTLARVRPVPGHSRQALFVALPAPKDMQNDQQSGCVVPGESHPPASYTEAIFPRALATKKLDVTLAGASETLHGFYEALLVRPVYPPE
ncbi:MAG TPA: hypothetical protein VIH93_04015, partial [Thermoanaerobaculia bacterium]